MKDLYPIRVTAWALAKILGEEMYKDAGACNWELVKNGCVASMEGDDWNASQPRIEEFLLDSHPLGESGKTLMVLDHGSGITDVKMQRYSTVGPSREERKRRPKGEHHGAAQNAPGHVDLDVIRREKRRTRGTGRREGDAGEPDAHGREVVIQP